MNPVPVFVMLNLFQRHALLSLVILKEVQNDDGWEFVA